MKEKTMCVKLPRGSKFRRVSVEGNGKIGIIYTQPEIPKPKNLVGGNGVYQDVDSPYWYCTLKNGDTFMYLYVEDLTEEDFCYNPVRTQNEYLNRKQESFKIDILEALANKPKKGVWLPVFESSADKNGNLRFVKDAIPLTGKMNAKEWKEKAREYSPENKSKMCSKTTYILMLLRWLKDQVATYEQIVYDSSELGTYFLSRTNGEEPVKTGQRKFGGLYGFVGNTYKIIENTDPYSAYRFLMAGGDCNNDGGFHCASKYGVLRDDELDISGYGVGLIELQ